MNTQTETEKSVNWHKAFCPVCQPIVNGHFIKRVAELESELDAERERNNADFIDRYRDVEELQKQVSELRAQLAASHLNKAESTTATL